MAALAVSGALAAAVGGLADESLEGAETFNFGHEFGVGPWGAWGAFHGGEYLNAFVKKYQILHKY